MNRLANVFFKNFFQGGLLIGVALTLIEYFRDSKKDVYAIAFITSSFFLIQLYKYNYINNELPQFTSGFIYHSIIGGIVYVLFIILMYVLYLTFHNNDDSPLTGNKNRFLIFINIFLYFLLILLYYIYGL